MATITPIRSSYFVTPDSSDVGHPTSSANPHQIQVEAHAKAIPSPIGSPKLRPREPEEIEIDSSSADLRQFPGQIYLARREIRPPKLDENAIAQVISRLQTDLQVALGKIQAKTRRKPLKESIILIEMRMSGLRVNNSATIKLRPCIWFFCGSKWCQRIIEKDVKELVWLRPYGIQYSLQGGPVLAAHTCTDMEDDPLHSQQTEPDDETTQNSRPGGDSGSCDSVNRGHSRIGDPTIPLFEPGYSEFKTHQQSLSEDQRIRDLILPGLPLLFKPGFSGFKNHEQSLSEDQCTGYSMQSSKLTVGSSNTSVSGDALTMQQKLGNPSSVTTLSNVDSLGHELKPEMITYTVPCEFRQLTGCLAQFAADEVAEAEWIQHVEVHLQGLFPENAVCWFCDELVFDANVTAGGDRRYNFILRLRHIQEHIKSDGDIARPQSMRPDYYILQHLRQQELLPCSVLDRWLSPTESLPQATQARDMHCLPLRDDLAFYMHLEQAVTNRSNGLTCCSSVYKGNESISQRFLTVGGIVAVTHGLQTELYGITCGHGFAQPWMEQRTSCDVKDPHLPIIEESPYLSDSESADSESDSDSESFKSANTQETRCETPPDPDVKWINVSQSLQGGFFDKRFPPWDEGIDVSQQTQMDIALFKVPHEYRFPNAYKKASDTPPTPIVSVLNGDTTVGQSLLVLKGREEVVPGCTQKSPFHFSVGGYTMHTDMLGTSEILDKGCSGSWVVADTQLCGMVVSVFLDEPYALIIPAKQLLADIKCFFPGATEVNVDVDANLCLRCSPDEISKPWHDNESLLSFMGGAPCVDYNTYGGPVHSWKFPRMADERDMVRDKSLTTDSSTDNETDEIETVRGGTISKDFGLLLTHPEGDSWIKYAEEYLPDQMGDSIEEF